MINKLCLAVLKRSVSQARDCIIIDGEDPFYTDESGRTYLQLSVFLRSNELVEFFLNEGLDVNQRDKNDLTALHRACRTGCEGIVEILLAHGADPNARANHQITPLHIASAYGRDRCIQVLCSNAKSTIQIDCLDEDEHTPLHFAAASGHAKAVYKLIEFGCNVNSENRVCNRPLHFVAVTDYPEICTALIEAGAQIDAQNAHGQTALHFATQQSSIDIVQTLLKYEADPNVRDDKLNTCSHLAIKNGNIDLVKIFMMDARTDPSLSDSEQDTVLHAALKLGHFNLIPMMLPRARDLTRQDANGCSVIIEAIKIQLEDLALEMLRTCPSLVHTATNELVTPLHLAAERGMTNLTKQLLIAGANVDATDSSGLTPSLYCAKNDSVLECLSMIEDIMMTNDNNIGAVNEEQQNGKATNQRYLSGSHKA